MWQLLGGKEKWGNQKILGILQISVLKKGHLGKAGKGLNGRKG